jgi:hypothetical protein
MPSSTSSSDSLSAVLGATPERHHAPTVDADSQECHEPPRYVRQTPPLDFRVVGMVACVVFALLLGTWEWHWRGEGVRPSTMNSDGLWAIQRRRIDQGEGNATVAIGSSRMLFGLQLDEWERLDGQRPIQLALEGTSPVPVLEDLAADTAFTGRLLVGVSPDLFFSGYSYRKTALTWPSRETPAQHAGQWLSQHLLEPVFAFLDPDYALFAVLKRAPWPDRAGVRTELDVRKLTFSSADRNTRMWERVERDTAYQQLAQRIWAQNFGLPPGVTPDMAAAGRDAEIEKAVQAVATLRARGVSVVFVRFPSSGGYYAFEQGALPRDSSWDVLITKAGVPGVHFEDHPTLQGYDTPEWSHLTAREADRYTAALHAIISRLDQQLWKPTAAMQAR